MIVVVVLLQLVLMTSETSGVAGGCGPRIGFCREATHRHTDTPHRHTRQTDTDRPTDRQTDRQTHTPTDRQTSRQADTGTETHEHVSESSTLTAPLMVDNLP